MTIEDSWGSEITTAAIAHLSHSTPKGMHFQSSPLQEYNTVCTATGGAKVADGFMAVSDAPGLGLELNTAALGKAFAEVS